MVSILNYFPKGKSARPGQAAILLQVEELLAKNDVLVLTAPTAFGKTELAVTLAAWIRGNVNYLQPNNILVDQAASRYSEFTPLHRRAAYPCLNRDHYDPEIPCRCQFHLARRTAQSAKIRLMNYWTYFANRPAVTATTLIFDEGHQVVDMLATFNNEKLLQSEFGFPDTLRTVGGFIEWAQCELEKADNDDLQAAVNKLSLITPEHGLVLKRIGSDVALSIQPVTAQVFGYLLWPRKAVRKLIFMSATIGPLDIKELGLDSLRVAYLDCESPIPPANRPLVYEPRYNLSHDCVPLALPVLAKTVEDLLKRHPEKGIIHVPYGLAGKLQVLCSHPRLRYHTKRTKASVLQEFKDSLPEDGAVLVASGLYEGVDLPYDAARWQLIAKVPFLSFADPIIELRAKHNPEWYAWETVKRLLQAYGRIVRAPDDQGISYICDTTFSGLFRRNKQLFPQFVRDALKGIK